MSKKDYITIAESFKYWNAREWESDEDPMIEFLLDICTTLKSDNPQFDKDRFLTACGVK